MSEGPWLPPDRTFASFLDKVVVKTKTDYEPDRKKGKGRVHKIAEFTVSVTESMSERFKVSGGGRARRCWALGGSRAAAMTWAGTGQDGSGLTQLRQTTGGLKNFIFPSGHV